MKDNDLITRREAELVLLEKGQRSRRYKLGDVWELNFDEIREALSEYQPKIVRCRDCIFARRLQNRFICTNTGHCESRTVGLDWFCADGERR